MNVKWKLSLVGGLLALLLLGMTGFFYLRTEPASSAAASEPWFVDVTDEIGVDLSTMRAI